MKKHLSEVLKKVYDAAKKRKFPKPDDVSNYSTSCHLKISDSKKILLHSLRNPPHAIIAKGTIKAEKGLSQLTSERNSEQKDSHVDWWIYADANTHLDFKEVKGDE